MQEYIYVRNNPGDRIDPSGLASFVAGRALQKGACKGKHGPTHTVSYNQADLKRCKVLLRLAAGGGPLKGFDCASALLKNFLLGPAAVNRLCPPVCKKKLLSSPWFNTTAQGAIDKAFPLQPRWDCGRSGNLNNVTRNFGGPCADPFVGSRNAADTDLAVSIGAVDSAQFRVGGMWTCGPPTKATARKCGCCRCTTTATVSLTLIDKYDFISTLPVRERRHRKFWCAAVLEDARVGSAFSTRCTVSKRVTTSREKCSIGRV